MGRHNQRRRHGQHRAQSGDRRLVLLVAAGAALAACFHRAPVLHEPPAPAVLAAPAAPVLSAMTDTVPGPPPAAVAVDSALSKRGVMYLWGAKGPDRFDCSGLVKWAWARAGVKLGDDTYTQVRQGRPVERGAVRPGDLIFPANSFDWRGPAHVQLAVSANEVIEAPSRGVRVRVAPMPAAYVARRPQ
jgi:cell wall-associated NlpC family hydrolase